MAVPLTSLIRYVNAVVTATGAGKTGLAHSDITAKYLVAGGTLTSLTTETITTLGTYQAPTSAAHIRIKEVNSADPTKGAYEVHFHDTQLATGAVLELYLSAADTTFERLELDLSNLRARLPDAPAGTINGLPTLASMGWIGGVVEDHASNSATQFQSDLAETTDDHYGDSSGGCVVVFLTGANAGQVRRITDYTGASGTVVVNSAYSAEPTAGDTFAILGRIEA